MSKCARKNAKRREKKQEQSEMPAVPGMGGVPKPDQLAPPLAPPSTHDEQAEQSLLTRSATTLVKTAGAAKMRLTRAFHASLEDEADHARVKVRLSKGLEKVLGRDTCFEDELMALLVDAGAVTALAGPVVPDAACRPSTSAAGTPAGKEQSNKWQRAAALARGLADPWCANDPRP
jgi:hypothetical protein